MPFRTRTKRAKKAFTVALLEEQLTDYSKEREQDVVEAVSSLAVPDAAALGQIATTLLQHAMLVDMYDRKPLAVLARRLHDRLPRFPVEGSDVSAERTSLATCMSRVCESTVGQVHEAIQDTPGACSAESSFNGGANDENAEPDACIGSAPLPSPREATTTGPAPHRTPPILHKLHALQTFCACLYTQDLVSELFIHTILDHVRYSTASWPEVARNAAIRGICDMTLFCGKRLESLGTLRSAMPDFYSHLELLAAGTALQESTRDRIRETLELRARNWQPPSAPDDEEKLCTVAMRAYVEASPGPSTPDRALTEAAAMHNDQELSLFGLAQPKAESIKKEEAVHDEPPVGFGAMLGAAGLSVESCAMPTAGSANTAPMPLGGFPMLDAEEPSVKVEDMLAAVQDMAM